MDLYLMIGLYDNIATLHLADFRLHSLEIGSYGRPPTSHPKAVAVSGEKLIERGCWRPRKRLRAASAIAYAPIFNPARNCWRVARTERGHANGIPTYHRHDAPRSRDHVRETLATRGV